MKSILQTEKRSYLSGDTRWLEKHHIFGGSNRRNSERYGLVVLLHHYECHIFGEKAVHNCRETMDKLHRMGQKMAMEAQGWTVIRLSAAMMGRPQVIVDRVRTKLLQAGCPL